MIRVQGLIFRVWGLGLRSLGLDVKPFHAIFVDEFLRAGGEGGAGG
jgi:hypothetical protein